MSFADRFCVCDKCGQTWVRTEFCWKPVDPNHIYVPKKKRGGYYKKRGYKKK